MKSTKVKSLDVSIFRFGLTTSKSHPDYGLAGFGLALPAELRSAKTFI